MVRTGTRDGFTLVELMVVLALISLIAAIAVPRTFEVIPGTEFRASTQELASGLRQARSLAIVQNAEVQFTFDGERGQYAVVPGRTAGNLPKDVDISLVTARSEVAGAKQGSIRFYPDGSSTGGRIELEAGPRSASIEVDWLTGRVSVRD